MNASHRLYTYAPSSIGCDLLYKHRWSKGDNLLIKRQFFLCNATNTRSKTYRERERERLEHKAVNPCMHTPWSDQQRVCISVNTWGYKGQRKSDNKPLKIGSQELQDSSQIASLLAKKPQCHEDTQHISWGRAPSLHYLCQISVPVLFTANQYIQERDRFHTTNQLLSPAVQKEMHSISILCRTYGSKPQNYIKGLWASNPKRFFKAWASYYYSGPRKLALGFLITLGFFGELDIRVFRFCVQQQFCCNSESKEHLPHDAVLLQADNIKKRL